MHIVPTQEDVVALLEQTSALRHGHFEYKNGLHANEYLQVALAMRYYQHAKTLSVGLSRLVRANPEIRAVIPELSIVAPTTGSAGGLWRVRSPASTPGLLGGTRKRERTTALSPVPRAGGGRRGASRGRHPPHGNEADTTEEAGRIERRTRGRVGGCGPPADAPNARLQPTTFLLSRQARWHHYQDAATCDLCQRGEALERIWV